MVVSRPGDERAAVERLLMDRARAEAERDRARLPRRWLQIVLGLAAAIGLVGLLMFGFDAFLTAMQKYMETSVEEPAPAGAPIPAYVVPEPVSPPPPAGQGPGPSPDPAPETSPASP
jgi:hypothetical protein